MRALYKVIIGFTALALPAGAIVGTQLATQDRTDRVAVDTPLGGQLTSDEITTPATTTTTTAPVPTTTPPPLPQPRLRTSTSTTPKPTTTTPKPKVTTPKPQPKPAGSTPCNAVAVRACIDLSANQSWLLDGAGNVTYGPVPITSGRPGWRTPTGTFRVQWKDIDHRSALFGNAPMPYSVFFNGGIAFHAGSLSVPSHGCIHLSLAAAKTYFNTLRVGDVVQVVP